MRKVEQVVHVLVAKPITWVIYGSWLGMKSIYQGTVTLGKWVHGGIKHKQAAKSPVA